jgi:hypothetical protein
MLHLPACTPGHFFRTGFLFALDFGCGFTASSPPIASSNDNGMLIGFSREATFFAPMILAPYPATVTTGN